MRPPPPPPLPPPAAPLAPPSVPAALPASPADARNRRTPPLAPPVTAGVTPLGPTPGSNGRVAAAAAGACRRRGRPSPGTGGTKRGAGRVPCRPPSRLSIAKCGAVAQPRCLDGTLPQQSSRSPPKHKRDRGVSKRQRRPARGATTTPRAKGRAGGEGPEQNAKGERRKARGRGGGSVCEMAPSDRGRYRQGQQRYGTGVPAVDTDVPDGGDRTWRRGSRPT